MDRKIIDNATSTITKRSWISLTRVFFFFPSKELIQLDISLGPGALGWINIISVSSVSFSVQPSMRPNAPNILEGHLPYPLGRRWVDTSSSYPPRACPIFKGLQRRPSSKRWDDRALPWAAFPVELIGRVSDLHGVYLAPSSPTGLNRSRK